MPVRTTCEECGKEFDCPTYRYKKNKRSFCSKECFIKHRKGDNTDSPCEVCGKIVHAKPYHRNKAKHICCSRECSSKLKKIIFLGAGNHQYGLKGRDNPSWKSDERIENGYVAERDLNHPLKPQNGMVLQHRLVAEKYLLTDENSVEIKGKRYLSPEYHVHHIDLSRDNNDPSNLLVLTKQQHMKLHGMLNETKRDEKTGRIVSVRVAKDFRTPEEILDITNRFISEYLTPPTITENLQISKER